MSCIYSKDWLEKQLMMFNLLIRDEEENELGYENILGQIHDNNYKLILEGFQYKYLMNILEVYDKYYLVNKKEGRIY